MKEGQKLFVTVHHAFNYNESQWDHLPQFDILTQFFEHRNNLKGYVSDDKGDRIEEGSDVAILVDNLYKSFDEKNIPKFVEKCLHDFEMYEILSEYHSPLEPEAIQYKEELLKAEQL